MVDEGDKGSYEVRFTTRCSMQRNSAASLAEPSRAVLLYFRRSAANAVSKTYPLCARPREPIVPRAFIVSMYSRTKPRGPIVHRFSINLRSVASRRLAFDDLDRLDDECSVRIENGIIPVEELRRKGRN